MSFNDQYQTANDKLHLSEAARARIEQALAEAEAQPVPMPPPARTNWYRLWIPISAVAATFLVLFIGVQALFLTKSMNFIAAERDSYFATSSDEREMPLISEGEDIQYEAVGPHQTIAHATSYDDIYESIIDVAGYRWDETAQPRRSWLSRLIDLITPFGFPLANSARYQLYSDDLAPDREGGFAASPDGLTSTESSREAGSVDGLGMGGGSEREFSKTNVQVEGIDEADIVKTDGTFLYILSDGFLVIAKADGKNTQVVSETMLVFSDTKAQEEDLREGDSEFRWAAPYTPTDYLPMEMFLAGDRLIVLITDYSYPDYGSPSSRDIDWYNPIARTFALTYDITDRSEPVKIAQSGQDGDYISSRLKDGVIYLITSHYVYNRPQRDTPRSFVPSLIDGTDAIALAPERILIPEDPASAGYIVITSISTKTGEHLDGQSLFGYVSTIYMSHDSLIVAQSVFSEEVIDKGVRGEQFFEHRRNGYTTHLIRFSIDQGKLSFEMETTVPGELLNQFSIDQYQNTIRVVTTIRDDEALFTRSRNGRYETIEPIGDRRDVNALFVLDLDGIIIGDLTGLAPDEQVYSVRFDGDIGYFVTFRQVDPLFAVDLSNPRNPYVLSELKIPGFSQYLHIYDDGLLFGLGMNADEDTGRTETIKLSMFDTSDPRNVTEIDKFITDVYYSEALYNHKAILVMPAIDLIAFPTDDGYLMFGYDDLGFFKRGTIYTERAYNARGVIIGEHLYLCSPAGIAVLDIESFQTLATIWF